MNATVDELSEIFDCDPKYENSSDEKLNVFSTFQTTSEDVKITMRIIVPIGEFRLQASRNEKVFFDFQSSISSSVKTEIFDDKHLLVIGSESEVLHTYIRIKPDFFVAQEIIGY
jgi:hypothetical protein